MVTVAWSVPATTAATGSGSLPLVGLLTVGGLVTAVLFGLALAAYLRRGTRSYLLVVGAVAALLGRSVVAGLSLSGSLAPATHHTLEHGLDVVMVALVVGAVYYARTVSREVEYE